MNHCITWTIKQTIGSQEVRYEMAHDTNKPSTKHSVIGSAMIVDGTVATRTIVHLTKTRQRNINVNGALRSSKDFTNLDMKN